MAPTKFSDIAKATKDILTEDYNISKVSLKCKKDAGPIAVTIDTNRNSSSGALSSKVGGKFAYAGLSVDKVQHEADGSPTLESSICPQPGLKLSFKGGKAADLGCDYKTGNICTTAKFDVKDMSKISTSAAIGLSGGIVLGGDASYDLKAKQVSGFNAGASYQVGPFFSALSTSGKMTAATLNTTYKATPELTLASSTTHSSTKHITLSGIGGVYSAPFGVIKAKIDGAGVTSACFMKDVVPKVKVTASGSIAGTDVSTFKYGFGITM